MRLSRTIFYLCLFTLTTLPALAEIKVTGRGSDKESTTEGSSLRVTETQLATRQTARTPSRFTTSKSKSVDSKYDLVPVRQLNTLSDLLFSSMDPDPAPTTDSSVSLTSIQTELTMAPGETRTIPVAISRNGAVGNLYLAALFDYGDSISEGDMQWMEQFSCTVNPLCPAAGLPFGNNIVDVQIQVQPYAQQGTVGTFRLTGHEVASGAVIEALSLTVLVEGDPIIASDTGLLSFQSGVTNPLINGSFVVDGQRIAAFLDHNNDGKVAFSNGSAEIVYPVGRYVNPYSDIGWSLMDGAAFDNGANLVVVGMLSSWSTVNRPQFVALYLKLDGQTVTPISMWAGDLADNAPLPEGATGQGIVMGTTYSDPPVIDIDPVTAPANGNAGVIRGTASGNVWTNTASGNLMGTSIVFNFDVPLQHDGND